MGSNLDIPDVDVDYFTCTLGQAALFDRVSKTCNTINYFIDERSATSPALPAVGFPRVQKVGAWGEQVLSK